MKKLSFSISQPSKPSTAAKKPSRGFADSENGKSTDEDSVNYVTEFDPAEALPDDGKRGRGALVIPPLPDRWDSHRLKRMKNLELPIAAPSDGPGGLQFEVESAAAAEDSNISYGLNLRRNGEKPEAAAAAVENGEDALLRRLKQDLREMPEDRGMAEFEDVPVEEFAKAVLAGYGWHEGRGIGRNAEKDVKVVEYTKRTDKHGLGFVSADLPNVVLGNGNGDRGDSKKSNSVARARERDGFVGKEVRIVGGREAGLKGKVVERSGDRKLAVRLSRSGETVHVGVGDVAEIGSREEERCLRRLKEQRAWEEEEKKAKAKEDRRREKENGGSDNGSERKKQASWVMSHIRVRIISRKLRAGGLYLKKGEVVDVAGPGVCDVSMDESREVIQGLSQDVLETVVPRLGGHVLVLLGKHKGVYGSLVERDSQRETGVVRDADSNELVNVRFEQISEFVGDPSYLGY